MDNRRLVSGILPCLKKGGNILNFRVYVYGYWRGKNVLQKVKLQCNEHGKNLVENLEFSTLQLLLFQGLSELVMVISRVKNKN